VLGPHGQAGVPMVFGNITIGGLLVPFVGSVPVYMSASGAGNGILWSLAVDATNVLIHEIRAYPTLGSGLTFPVTVYISDRIVA
jgi:hypothetical protein